MLFEHECPVGVLGWGCRHLLLWSLGLGGSAGFGTSGKLSQGQDGVGQRGSGCWLDPCARALSLSLSVTWEEILSLCLSFLCCDMEVITAPPSQDCLR